MKNKKTGFISTLLVSIVTLLVIGGGAYFYVSKNSNPADQNQIENQVENIATSTSDSSENAAIPIISKQSPTACTMDAKQCPDGTYVGRTGPNCEFVCPTSLINENASGIIKSVYTKSGKNYIDIDYVNFVSGGPNGVSMENNNPKIRTFEISSEAKFVVNNDSTNKNDANRLDTKQITFSDFKKIISNTEDFRSGNPWDIIVENSAVTSIKEHYIP